MKTKIIKQGNHTEVKDQKGYILKVRQLDWNNSGLKWSINISQAEKAA
jgi:hypothetical protein